MQSPRANTSSFDGAAGISPPPPQGPKTPGDAADALPEDPERRTEERDRTTKGTREQGWRKVGSARDAFGIPGDAGTGRGLDQAEDPAAAREATLPDIPKDGGTFRPPDTSSQVPHVPQATIAFPRVRTRVADPGPRPGNPQPEIHSLPPRVTAHRGHPWVRASPKC
jgi:hypothetical protein